MYPAHLDLILCWCRLDAHLSFTSDSFYTVSKSGPVYNNSGCVSLRKSEIGLLNPKEPVRILRFFGSFDTP